VGIFVAAFFDRWPNDEIYFHYYRPTQMPKLEKIRRPSKNKQESTIRARL